MKYIRTKDGIYKLMFAEEREMCFDHKTLEPAYYSINHERIAKRDVIKEADTIEELCDEFVYVNKIDGLVDKTHTISFEDMSNHQFTEPTVAEKLEYICKRYKDDLDKIKLGIWTDIGLIYVAKMNDKGELELI